MLPQFYQEQYASSKWGVITELRDDLENITMGKRIVPLKPKKILFPVFRKPFELRLGDAKTCAKGIAFMYTKDVIDEERVDVDRLYKLSEKMTNRSFIEGLYKTILGTETKFRVGTPLVTPRLAYEETASYLKSMDVNEETDVLFWSTFCYLSFVTFDSAFSYSHLSFLIDGWDGIPTVTANGVLQNIVRDKLEHIFETVFTSSINNVLKGDSYIRLKTMAENAVNLLRDAVTEIREIVKFSHAFISTMSRLRVFLYYPEEMSVEQKNRFQLNPDFLELASIFDLQVGCVARDMFTESYSEDQWPLFDSLVLRSIRSMRSMELMELDEVRKIFGLKGIGVDDADYHRIVFAFRHLDNSRVKSEGVYRHPTVVDPKTSTTAVYFRKSNEALFLEQLANDCAAVAARVDLDDVLTKFVKSIVNSKTKPCVYSSADLKAEELRALCISLCLHIEMILDEASGLRMVRYVGVPSSKVDKSQQMKYLQDDVIKTFSIHRLIFCCATAQQPTKIDLSEFEFKVDFSGSTDYVELKPLVTLLDSDKKIDVEIILDHLGDFTIRKAVSWNMLIGTNFSKDLGLTNVPVFRSNLAAPSLTHSIFNDFCTINELEKMKGGWFNVSLSYSSQIFRNVMSSEVIEKLAERLFEHIWSANPTSDKRKFRDIYATRPGALTDKYTMFEFKKAVVIFLYKFLGATDGAITKYEELMEMLRAYYVLVSDEGRMK